LSRSLPVTCPRPTRSPSPDCSEIHPASRVSGLWSPGASGQMRGRVVRAARQGPHKATVGGRLGDRRPGAGAAHSPARHERQACRRFTRIGAEFDDSSLGGAPARQEPTGTATDRPRPSVVECTDRGRWWPVAAEGPPCGHRSNHPRPVPGSAGPREKPRHGDHPSHQPGNRDPRGAVRPVGQRRVKCAPGIGPTGADFMVRQQGRRDDSR
jgi:hypothetical protein